MITQLEVQRALRYLHSEQFIETTVAQRLTHAFPTQNARDAFITAVSTSFDCSEVEDVSELRDLLFKSDIEALVSRPVAAQRCNISVRSFYRKHKLALSVVTGYLNNVLGTDPSTQRLLRAMQESPPHLTHGQTVISGSFARSQASFELHRRAGDLLAMQHDIAAISVFRDSLSDADALELKLMQIEIMLKRRDLAKAEKALRAVCESVAASPGRRLTSLALLKKAQLAFLVGNLYEALRCAAAIVEASSPSEPAWAEACALVGRASTLSGSRWSYMHDPSLNVWNDLNLQNISARHDLLAGRYEDAHGTSLRIFAESRSHGFLPVAAYAAATLAGCYSSTDPTARDSWAVTALQLFAASGSTIDIAKDLFQFGTHGSTGWLTRASQDDLLEIYSCLRPVGYLSAFPAFRPLIAALIRTVIERTDERQTSETALDDLVELAWEAGRTTKFVPAIAKELESLSLLGEFLKVVSPIADQARYTARFNSAAGIVVRGVTRALTHRQIRALSYVS